MKTIYMTPVLATTLILAGCASTSKVQEMIDASHRDYLNRADAHEESIDVLKKSAMTGLETSKENAEKIAEIQVNLDEASSRLKIIQGYAEASKVMSAANTVKVADLEDAMLTNQELTDATTKKLAEIDKLYEEVMITHYQTIVDSATAAIESLQENGAIASTNAPVRIDEPIEIVAPDTAPEVNANTTR